MHFPVPVNGDQTSIPILGGRGTRSSTTGTSSDWKEQWKQIEQSKPEGKLEIFCPAQSEHS